MANSVSEWSAVAASNTSLGAVSLQENIMLVNAVNNAFRELMAQVASGISNGDFGTSVPFTAASASAAASLEFAEDTDNGVNKITVTAPAAVASDKTLTLPDATDTLVGKATTDTLTNKTLTTPTMTGPIVTTTAVDLQVGQITFPATQNSSSGANTLDDYEESTWTPTYTQSGALTMTNSRSVSTKVGRQVTATSSVTFTNAGTAANQIRLTNLPVPAATAGVASATIGSFSYNDAGLLYVGVVQYNTGISACIFIVNGATDALGVNPAVTVANGDVMQISICYDAAT